MEPRDPVDWIALNFLSGLGPATLLPLAEARGGPAEVAYRLPLAELLRVARRQPPDVDRLARARKGLRRRAEREARRCRRAGIDLVCWDSTGYPELLRRIAVPPLLLYVRGCLEPDPLRIGVVGSRTPTGYGRRVAVGLGSGLAARGAQVVSGGARGVDTLAHQGALEGGGTTVAVLGSGLAIPYPEENAGLFERLADGGAVVSEFPLDEAPRRENFPRRNRLISGLAVALVVVEAAERSGSLITASHALEQGREVMAVPGPVSSAKSEGCNRLIQQGAKLVQNIEDIFDDLPPGHHRPGAPPSLSTPAPRLAGLSPDERSVLKMMDAVEPVHLDDLADRAPFGIGRLQTALFGLEVRGAVEQTPGRYYLLRPRKER